MKLLISTMSILKYFIYVQLAFQFSLPSLASCQEYIPYAAHTTGKLTCWILDNGDFGQGDTAFDVVSGKLLVGSTYPQTSKTTLPRISLRFTSLTKSDTIGEFFRWQPDAVRQKGLLISSGDRRRSFYSPKATAPIEIRSVFQPLQPDSTPLVEFGFDTPPVANRAIDVSFTMISRSWYGELVDDFVICHVSMSNNSTKDLFDNFVAYEVIRGAQDYSNGLVDLLYCNTVAGFRSVRITECETAADLPFAYVTSADGQPSSTDWLLNSPRTASGITFLKLPDAATDLSFNWFSLTNGPYPDRHLWGPARRREGKRNEYPSVYPPKNYSEWYQFLSSTGLDYDQLFAAKNMTSLGWAEPTSDSAKQVAFGTPHGPSMFFGFGPFDLPVGASVSWVFAIVGGDSVHVYADDFARLFDYQNPEPYINSLDFSQLDDHTRWASWVYDNPGIDTDGDGYRGEYEICNANPDIGFIGDTLWYQGDGIPDYRADLPPPSPPTRIYTSEGKLVIRWNGFDVEKTIDPFTRKMDFQGYKIYMGRDPRLESLVLHSQWDKEDYIALKFVLRADGDGDWVPDSEPMSLDSITDYYDLTEHPLSYTRQNSYSFNNANYYFEKQDNNVSDLSNLSGIHKAYPNATPPVSSDSLLWTESEYTTEHGRKYPKYTEYEYIIDGILPSVPYYVAVTAFDHGFVLGGMPPQESDPVKSLQQTLALPSADSVEANNLDVFCYPNPYRIDDNYVDRGYENRDQSIPNQKAGRIHFANLPRKCTISIFSLDGDRIWSYDHNPPQYSSNDMHAEWDLISRNRQLVVSGLYYWVVESETRTQIGKLMILK